MSERQPHLRVAKPGEKTRRKAAKSITEALDGSSRDVLASMRRALAKKLDAGEISSNAIASAYKELRELDRLIRLADLESQDDVADRGVASDERFDASVI